MSRFTPTCNNHVLRAKHMLLRPKLRTTRNFSSTSLFCCDHGVAHRSRSITTTSPLLCAKRWPPEFDSVVSKRWPPAWKSVVSRRWPTNRKRCSQTLATRLEKKDCVQTLATHHKRSSQTFATRLENGCVQTFATNRKRCSQALATRLERLDTTFF